MSIRDLVIWGASGHATVIADAVRLTEEYRIVGYLDDHDPSPRRFGGASVLGGREKLPELRADGVSWLIVAIGDCQARLNLAETAREAGFRFATVRHPTATVASESDIGPGSFLAAGSVLGPHAVVRNHVILNTRSSVDHHCHIEAGAHIGPGVMLAGRVRVGRASFLGIGSCVADGVTIGENTVIGAGAAVVRDIPDHCLAVGVPARVIRHRKDPRDAP